MARLLQASAVLLLGAVLLGSVVGCCYAYDVSSSSKQSQAGSDDIDGIAATKGLLSRLLGEQPAGQFELRLLQPSVCAGETKLCFGYAAVRLRAIRTNKCIALDVCNYSAENSLLRQGSGAGRVALSGTTGVELAMAANHYLKYVANVSVSWENTGGTQAFVAPGPLPQPAAPVHIERSTTYHYYANVCTFSYSFVWYTLDDWVREIDCACAFIKPRSSAPPQPLSLV